MRISTSLLRPGQERNLSGFADIHRLFERLPLLDHSTRSQLLPKNGVYVFYETGESFVLGDMARPRIVRVGTHTRPDRLRDRTRTHFNGNKNSSVFRKHLGAAIIRRQGASPRVLKNWMKEGLQGSKGIETIVTSELKSRFSYRCIEVRSIQERLDLERNIIASISEGVDCQPSSAWLGLFSPSPTISSSGLWNERHVLGHCPDKHRFIITLAKLVERESIRLSREKLAFEARLTEIEQARVGRTQLRFKARYVCDKVFSPLFCGLTTGSARRTRECPSKTVKGIYMMSGAGNRVQTKSECVYPSIRKERSGSPTAFQYELQISHLTNCSQGNAFEIRNGS